MRKKQPSVFFIAAALSLLSLSYLPAQSMEQAGSPLSCEIVYYGEIGCSHCDRFESETVPLLEGKYNIEIRLAMFDILDPDIYRKCSLLLGERGYEFRYFPVVIIGNNIYQGETEISRYLDDELDYFTAHGHYMEERGRDEALGKDQSQKGNLQPAKPGSAVSWAVVFTAGAVDGINPCAFTVLLFFFSYLTLRRKNYREFITSGAVFIASVFVTYFSIGFGFYSLVSMVFDFQAARLALRIVISILTALFAILSFADFLSLRGNNAGKVILKLPAGINNMIHMVIREKTGKAAMAGGVFLTGAAVSVLELACTGQVYLPSIIYMLESGSKGLGLLLLVSYNAGFILPLVMIYFLLAKGYRVEKISSFFRRNAGISKALLALVFMVLAVSVWIL